MTRTLVWPVRVTIFFIQNLERYRLYWLSQTQALTLNMRLAVILRMASFGSVGQSTVSLLNVATFEVPPEPPPKRGRETRPDGVVAISVPVKFASPSLA